MGDHLEGIFCAQLVDKSFMTLSLWACVKFSQRWQLVS